MGIPVMIMGESGSGKTTSLRNLKPHNCLLVQTITKPLPFKSTEWKRFNPKERTGQIVATDNWEVIRKVITDASSLGRSTVIIDDFQYLLANEFMRNADEKGFQKFTDIANHAWSVIMSAINCHESTRVYFLTHTESDDNGNVKAKTIGKLLDDKITLEGMFTIVLRALKDSDRYVFNTQTNGNDRVKSPLDMFESYQIDNDLAEVDKTICNYYDISTLQGVSNASAKLHN